MDLHLPTQGEGKYLRMESQVRRDPRASSATALVATKVNGKYWMYFNVPDILVATSDDLIDWTPLADANGKLARVLSARPGLLRFVARRGGTSGDPDRARDRRALQCGEQRRVRRARPARARCTRADRRCSTREPVKLIARSDTPFIRPTEAYERTGQYLEGTTFVEGLVPFKGRWLLYYGMADSRVGVAVGKKP